MKIMDVTRNILISWGVLKEEGGKVYPTNAYALLTGRMVGQPVIQCGVFKGTNRAHFVDRREFEGSIQEQMDAAYQYVLEKINMGMTIKGMYRQDVYELPTDSIRELIANAVAHRSYLEPGNIQVALYDDRLEITSPGMLLNNVTIEKMIKVYDRVNNKSNHTYLSVCLFNTTQRRMTAHSAIRIHVKILVYHTPQKPREVRNINIAANTILPPTSNAPFIIEKNTSPIPFNAPRII